MHARFFLKMLILGLLRDNLVQNNIFALVNRENCDAAVRSSAHNSPGDEGYVQFLLVF